MGSYYCYRCIYLNRAVLAVLVITTLGLIATVPHGFVENVAATGALTDFVILAFFAGWNATATSAGNPQITEYVGVPFTVTAKYTGDFLVHRFAIYTANFPDVSVTQFDTCSLTNTNGCLAASPDISSTSKSVSLTFTPGPLVCCTGPGVYEYYCQFHSTTMHGKFRILKNPDIDGDHAINFIELGLVGAAFLSTPTSPNWNPGADLNNDGVVNFLDLGIVGGVFLRTL